MKPPRFEHAAPATLAEAIGLLARHGEDARVLAGGQSLMPVLNFRLASPKLLVDLNDIAPLAGIRASDGALAIGAMTRHRDVERSAVVANVNPLLHAAMPWIAHTAIRNRGTLGGSLAHADPAAELPAVALAGDASLTIEGSAGVRSVPAAEFFLGLFTTAVQPGEVLTDVRFPAWPPGRRHAFREIARRLGDFAIVGVAATADPGPDGRVAQARIVVFGATDRPVRAHEAEALVTDEVITPELARDAGREAALRLDARGDHHASAPYRRELAEALVARALHDLAQPPHAEGAR